MPGGIYHVMLWGNGGQDIFFAEEGRREVYRLLAEGTTRFEYRVHAYCLISNHLHLAVEVGRLPLSRGMQNLVFRYTRWIDRRKKRVGRAWGLG